MQRIACLLFTCLFLAAVPGRAQRVVYSDLQDFSIQSGDFSVVGKAGGKLYTFRGGAEGSFLDAWNDSMVRTATIILDFFPKKIYDSRFSVAGDKITVLYQGVDGRTVTQYAALLDGDGRLVKGPVKLDEVRTSIFGATKTYFTVATSEDKKRTFIYNLDASGKSFDFKGVLLDENLTVLRRPRGQFKADDDISVGEVALTNAGTVFIPAYAQNGRDLAERAWVLRLADSANRLQPIEVPLGGKFAAVPVFKPDNVNNLLYISGFYSDKRSGNVDGVLFSTVNMATNVVDRQRLMPFDDRLRMSAADRSTKRAFNEYRPRQIVVRNDGGFVLISEDYFLTIRSGYTPGWGYYSFYYSPLMMSAPQIREYHYNDILVLSYAADGTLEWPAFVRKDQYSQEDGGAFSSYALLNTGSALGFLYNDFNRSRSTVQLATVSADGATESRSFSLGGVSEPDWLPRSAKQVGARELVVPCVQKRQICFAKVTF